jgi:pimeloyl-ACP methyl ester carboxylesterase
MKLVILPGFDGSATFSAEFIRRLPTDIACEAIALPQTEPMDYAELAAFVTKKLPTEDFVLLGQSFSGPLCVSVAQAAARNLKGIILVGTFAVRPLPVAMSLLARLILNTAGKINLPVWFLNNLLLNNKDDRTAVEICAVVRSLPKDVFIRRGEEALGANVRPALANVTVPALILEAGQDRLLRRGTSGEIAQSCRKAILRVIDGPHLLLQQSPEKTAAAVAEFIKML